MPVPANVSRIVFSGALPGGEKWSCGFYQVLPPPGNRVSAQESADAIATGTATAVRAVATAAMAGNPQEVTTDQVTVYQYANAGGKASDVGIAAMNLAGSQGQACPNQTALVTTLRSAVPTGSGRGRCYWPWLRPASIAGGLAASAEIQTLVNRLAQLAPNLVVVSEKESVARVVTRVDADRVLDTMNSRRRGLVSSRLKGS